jgi:acyl-CoA synthetase (AMP-forming)/AMP-acid ligase II
MALKGAVQSVKWPEGLKWMTVPTKGLSPAACQKLTLPALDVSDLVFLQFTSGSTGDPKGVMISHRNLVCTLCVSRALLGCRFRACPSLSYPYPPPSRLGAQYLTSMERHRQVAYRR